MGYFFRYARFNWMVTVTMSGDLCISDGYLKLRLSVTFLPETVSETRHFETLRKELQKPLLTPTANP